MPTLPCIIITRTVLPKKIETKFYFGSLLHSIIIYSMTSHEITPTFYLPDDDLKKVETLLLFITIGSLLICSYFIPFRGLLQS